MTGDQAVRVAGVAALCFLVPRCAYLMVRMAFAALRKRNTHIRRTREERSRWS